MEHRGLEYKQKMLIIAGKSQELYKAKEKASFRGKMALVIP